MPGDLKERLKAFVPAPAKTKISGSNDLPATYDVPYKEWNQAKRIYEEKTDPKPMTLREIERTAQRELLSVLRLADAGKLAVSDKTRRPSNSTLDRVTAGREADVFALIGPKRFDVPSKDLERQAWIAAPPVWRSACR